MKRHGYIKKQRGAVLVLALLILSFVMFTALSMVSVLLVELRSAKYLDSAIIAHYAAESGAEQALFRLKQAHNINQLASGNPDPYGIFFNLEGHSDFVLHPLTTPPDTARSFTFTKISKSSANYTAYNLPSNQSVQFDIFDPQQETSPSINTQASTLNLDWTTYVCHGSDRLEVSLLELQNIGAQGLQIVPGPQNPKREYPICNCLGGSVQCDSSLSSITLNPSSFYRIGVRPIDHDVQSVTISLSGNSGQVDIPSQIYIQTIGKYKDATQTVTVQTPWNNGVADLFNYVIFSESSLIKNVINQNTSSFQSRCGFCSQNHAIGCSSESDCSGLSPTTCSLNPQAFCSETHANPNAESNSGTFLQNSYGSCNAKCSGFTYCGDGVAQGSLTGGVDGDATDEKCDDGNSSEIDQCNNQCQPTKCGDAVVQQPNGTGSGFYEVCDEGACGQVGLDGVLHTAPNCNGSGVGHCNLTCSQVQQGGGGGGGGKNCPPNCIGS